MKISKLIASGNRGGLAKRVNKIAPVLAVRAASAGVSYLGQLAMARYFLSDADFGSYAIFLTLVNLLAIIIKGGLDTATIKFTSIYRATSDYRERVFKDFSYIYVLIASCFLWVAFQFGWSRAGTSSLGLPDESLNLVVISVFALSIAQLQRVSIVAKKHPVSSEWHNGILRPLITVGISYVLLTLSGEFSYIWAATAYALSLLLVALLGALVDHHYGANCTYIYGKHFKAIRNDGFNWLSVSWVMGVNVILRQLFKNVDILVCGYFLEQSSVAYYAAATRVANLVVFGLSSTNMIFAPRISESYHKREMDELKKIVSQSAKLVFFIGLFFFLVMLFGGQILLGFFGDKYTAAYSSLLLLSIAQLINSYYGPIGYLASMTGNEKKLTKIILIISPVSIIAYCLLVPMLGIIGAALGSAIGIIGWNFLLNRALRSEIGIDSRAFEWSLK